MFDVEDELPLGGRALLSFVSADLPVTVLVARGSVRRYLRPLPPGTAHELVLEETRTGLGGRLGRLRKALSGATLPLDAGRVFIQPVV